MLEVAYVPSRINDGTVTKRTRDSPPAGTPRAGRPYRAVDPEGRSWLGIAPPGAEARTSTHSSWLPAIDDEWARAC